MRLLDLLGKLLPSLVARTMIVCVPTERASSETMDLKGWRPDYLSSFSTCCWSSSSFHHLCSYTPCEDVTKISPGPNFTNPTNDVRDTLEQIDTTHELISRYPADIALADSTETFRKNFKDRKLSHFIGIEGAHSLGNSLATLRSYQRLGVRYVTLTHTCHVSCRTERSYRAFLLRCKLIPLALALSECLCRLGWG